MNKISYVFLSLWVVCGGYTWGKNRRCGHDNLLWSWKYLSVMTISTIVWVFFWIPKVVIHHRPEESVTTDPIEWSWLQVPHLHSLTKSDQDRLCHYTLQHSTLRLSFRPPQQWWSFGRLRVVVLSSSSPLSPVEEEFSASDWKKNLKSDGILRL